MPDMQREVGGWLRDRRWLRDGRLRYRESVVEGLDRAPEALVNLLSGATIGKTLVSIA